MKEIYSEVLNSYKSMILSASGWRKIFAKDKNENSMTPDISPSDQILAAGIGTVFVQWAKKYEVKTVVMANDTRPTGPALAQIIGKTIILNGLKIEYLGIASAPEIMSFVKKNKNFDSFVYISASHNPAGHNGIKFGLRDGAVIGGKYSAEIISLFKNFMENTDNYPMLENILLQPALIKNSDMAKKDALSSYMNFNLSTAFPDEALLKKFQKLHKPGIIADMNGSARTLSIDRMFFDKLGIKYEFINSEPGKIAHGILPEGKNLTFAAEFLEKKFREDNSFTIGYLPDNDGDRGNLVFINPETGKAIVPDAQSIFALCCVSELSFMEYAGMLNPEKTAVVVNCPTSLRIEKIAEKFQVQVFRAEVGEANVVNLARELRDSGFTVRFMGEGSNGGNITYPATVRDPLNTIISIVKFISNPDIFNVWNNKLKSKLKFTENVSLPEILSTLPKFITTSTDDPMAKLHIKCSDHGIFKNCYEEIFLQEWEKKKDFLQNTMGIASWKEINTIGTSSIIGMGSKFRTSGVKGGLKILFSDCNNEEIGYIWMRGSGTEPIFRISADICTDKKENECFLINWQKEMAEKADLKALQKQDCL